MFWEETTQRSITFCSNKIYTNKRRYRHITHKKSWKNYLFSSKKFIHAERRQGAVSSFKSKEYLYILSDNAATSAVFGQIYLCVLHIKEFDIRVAISLKDISINKLDFHAIRENA